MREIPSSGIGADSALEHSRRQEWEDNSVIMLLATRGMVRLEVWRSHDRLLWPMNQKRVKFDAVGMEVGAAYEHLFKTAVEHRACNKWPFILTYEEDNLPEPEAFYKLLKAIRHCPDCREPLGNKRMCSSGHHAYDGVAGLYWTKVRPPSPMAFGNPSKPRDFSTQNVLPHIEAEDELDQVLEVNAIPMGFTLYRRELFEEVPKPWFKTYDPSVDTGGEPLGAVGQDIGFCLKAKELVGARFAVHCGTKVGHIDTATGRVF